jgi:hypothetical protein
MFQIESPGHLDERDTFTDYEIAIRSVLFQREAMASFDADSAPTFVL